MTLQKNFTNGRGDYRRGGAWYTNCLKFQSWTSSVVCELQQPGTFYSNYRLFPSLPAISFPESSSHSGLISMKTRCGSFKKKIYISTVVLYSPKSLDDLE